MKKFTRPLKTDTYYHIYNRGVNSEDIFKEERNYEYFLEKLTEFLSPYIDVYAYCLLKNHFHLLIKTKTEDEIVNKFKDNILLKDVVLSTDKILSKQFATFFKGYTLAINKAYNRTGGLFEPPFRRIEVEHDSYFSQLVSYIHWNPQKHGFVNDFRDYSFSSYNSMLSAEASFLKSKEVINWFGGVKQYVEFHTNPQNTSTI